MNRYIDGTRVRCHVVLSATSSGFPPSLLRQAVFTDGVSIGYYGIRQNSSSQVRLTTRSADGTETVFSSSAILGNASTVVQDSSGLYYVDVPVAMTVAGPNELWNYEWRTTGSVVYGPADGQFTVLRSNV